MTVLGHHSSQFLLGTIIKKHVTIVRFIIMLVKVEDAVVMENRSITTAAIFPYTSPCHDYLYFV